MAHPVSAPPEVEATLARLTSYKDVQGVLILARPNGIILRSSGSLFALPPSSAAVSSPPPRAEGDEEGEEKEEESGPKTSEVARKYARAATRMVEAIGIEVRDCDEDKADDLRFLRIRTKRHELIITPDEQYILVVVQDPAH
ncbi:RHTO0S05e01068g1_1 [Rhodotorula toruloides]|uniref:RHTO0S05e01068g1_1 n=2 Tax=Rhodotorula toruloides TaxID=5286 RepID=A0A061ARM1_RHOTO|nr:Dynein light chain-related protein [Rhodotorula toruloides NP11]EMS20761.1 Dynein light chain-related protein [Rhodotorula toruloides NP11]CDR40303.1 RHTO0S05e01068g1_1 [Rhodotorula toruloides]